MATEPMTESSDLNVTTKDEQSSTTQSEKKNKKKTYIIIGIILGLIIVIAIIGCLMYRYCFVKSKPKIRLVPETFNQRTPRDAPVQQRPMYQKPDQPQPLGSAASVTPYKPSKRAAQHLLWKGKSEASGMTDI